MAEPLKKVQKRGPAKGAPKVIKPSAKLTLSDYELCITWLQIPGNLEKIEGAEGKTKVGGKVIVKTKAYKELAQYVNANQKKGSTLREVTGKSMKNRWQHFFDKYRKVKDDSQATGWGLTAEDEQLGITTIEQKLEFLCPLYHKVHALYENNAKVDGLGNYDSVLKKNSPDAVAFPWSVVVDSIPTGGLASEGVAAGQRILSSGPEMEPQEGLEDQINATINGVNVNELDDDMPNQENVEQAHSEGLSATNRGGGEDNRSPEEGAPIEVEDEEDLESPDRVSEVPEARTHQGTNEGGGATSAGVTNGKRTRSMSVGGKEKVFPSKKQVVENRHSINAAFTDSLGSINETKLRLAELEEKKFSYQSGIDERKLQSEQERFWWEKERVELDRGWEKERAELELMEKREARVFQAKEQLKQAALSSALSSGRSLDEIQSIYNIFR